MQTVRLLRWSDAWFCYKLAKDPTVREASLDSRAPTLLGHLRWMWRWIRDKDRIAWIIARQAVTAEYRHVGLIRYDRSTREVGIAVARRYRGQGIALEALRSASPYFYREGGEVLAVIKLQNTASLALFKKAGYRTRHMGGNITMEWRPE